MYERLAPRMRAFASNLARKYAAAVEYDDVVQLGYIALWRIAASYPGDDANKLFYYACLTLRRSLIDEVRARFGRRRHIQRYGFSFEPGIVEGLRACGELPRIEWGFERSAFGGECSYTILGLIDDRPSPEEAIDQQRQAAARWASLRPRLEQLSERDLRVIALAVFGIKQRVIADLMGVTEPRVSQIVRAFFYGQTRHRKRRRPVAVYSPAA